MAKKNILIKKSNSDGWDELYPITSSNNVISSNGKSVESEINSLKDSINTKQNKLAISDSVSSTSTTTVANSASVKKAYDKGTQAKTVADGAVSKADKAQKSADSALSKANQAFQSASEGKSKIAGAITGKGVSTNPSDTFQKMADNIDAISTDQTGDATAIARNILSGKTAYVKGKKLTGTMPDKGGFSNASFINLWPDNSLAVYFKEGYYSGGMDGGAELKVTVPQIEEKQPDLKPENIRPGKNIFGKAGTFTKDATASASHILSGKTAYVNGNKLSGSMANRGNPTIIPTKSTRKLSSGYYSGVTINGDGDLIPENIKEGKNIFGVKGSMKESKLINGTIPISLVDEDDIHFVRNISIKIKATTTCSDANYFYSVENEAGYYTIYKEKMTSESRQLITKVRVSTSPRESFIVNFLRINSFLYLVSDKRILKLSLTGKVIYDHKLSSSCITGGWSQAEDKEGAIYVLEFNEDNDYVSIRKIDKNGKVQWSKGWNDARADYQGQTVVAVNREHYYIAFSMKIKDTRKYKWYYRIMIMSTIDGSLLKDEGNYLKDNIPMVVEDNSIFLFDLDNYKIHKLRCYYSSSSMTYSTPDIDNDYFDRYAKADMRITGVYPLNYDTYDKCKIFLFDSYSGRIWFVYPKVNSFNHKEIESSCVFAKGGYIDAKPTLDTAISIDKDIYSCQLTSHTAGREDPNVQCIYQIGVKSKEQ